MMKWVGERFGRFLVIPRLVRDGRVLVCMLKDWWAGEYRKVPYLSIGAVLFSLIYIMTPLDLIPDYLIGLGQIDDIFILGLCLYLTERDLAAYEVWRSNRRA